MSNHDVDDLAILRHDGAELECCEVRPGGCVKMRLEYVKLKSWQASHQSLFQFVGA